LAFRLRGLRAQIVLWTVLPLTLVLIGVAFTGVYSHEQAMRVLVEERDQALAVLSASQVRDLLRRRADVLQTLAAAQAFHHQDPAGQHTLLVGAEDGSTELVEAPDGLFAGGIALVDGVGEPLATGTTVPLWLQEAGRVADLATAVMVHQEATLSPLFDAPWGEGVLLMGVPVYDAQGTAYGALVSSLSLGSLELEPLLGQVQVGEHGVVYVVDAAGRVLAHSPSPQARSNFAGHTGLSTAFQNSGPGTTLCRAPDGEQMTLAYAPLDWGGLDWRVIVEQPWQEVVGPVLRYSQFMPLVAALAAIVSLLTLYYGVRSIVRPLQALGREAERVAWGDFEATSAPVGGVQEIEDLRRTLDQMAKRIQGYQRGMHDYIAAITRGQEEERKRLARELHDDTAQALIALGQRVEMAQKLLASDPERAAERLAQIRVLLGETLDGVRRFSRDLRPIYLEDLGFVPALEMLTRPQTAEPGSLDIYFATAGSVRRLPSDLELAAYRIVQEALNNVIQHAQAGHAWVEVRFEAQQLVLSVRDDGRGFRAPDLPDVVLRTMARQGHFGLMGIQERAFLYGGQLTLRSAPGEGTEVAVRLPYPAQD
jgi:signal transduction histidine kinase